MWKKNMTKHFGARVRPSQGGFTLTELLVAIGLLVIIMLSVSTVFRATGQTVSVGVATLEANRKMLTAQTTLQGDICGFGVDPFDLGQGMWAANANPALGENPPFLIIRNEAPFSFLNRDEWIKAGSPGTPPLQLNFFNSLSNQERAKYLHRKDILAFFARGTYKRQTGGNRVGLMNNDEWRLITDMWGLNQAYIWYGHLRLPNDNGTGYRIPGEGTWVKSQESLTPWNPYNPNNYFASQWILGRTQIALVQPQPLPGHPNYLHYVPDLYRNPVYYYARKNDAPADSLTPLSQGHASFGWASNPSSAPDVYTSEEITESRFDIAGMNSGQTWHDYGDIVNAFWIGTGTHLSPQRRNWADDRFSTRFLANPYAVGNIDWSLAGAQKAFSATNAQQVPVFLPGCIQFIVEFAGDYVHQQSDGSVSAVHQAAFDISDGTTYHLDNEIDFDIVPNVNGVDVRQIHWYGYPRSVVDGSNNIVIGRAGDVTTVSQMRAAQVSPSYRMPFEHAVFNGNGSGTYTCGWTRDMLYLPAGVGTLAPQLIRITVQVVDAEGRLQDGMTRQFIFPVKRM